MAQVSKPFRVKYAPPGMTWAEAKAAGAAPPRNFARFSARDPRKEGAREREED